MPSGVKHTLADVARPLQLVPTAALLGGTALYLLAHVAFRLRNMHTLIAPAAGVAVVLIALVPVTSCSAPPRWRRWRCSPRLTALILYEVLRYADVRDRVRHGVAAAPEATPLPSSDAPTAATESRAGTA